MCQDRACHGLDVVGNDVRAAVEGGRTSGDPQQMQRGSGRCPEPQFRVPARGRHQIDDVLPQLRRDVDGADGVRERCHLRRAADRFQRVQRGRGAVRFQHQHLSGRAGIPHRDPRHEPVALGFRQRVGALHLHGVLGGHHEEGPAQRVGDPVDADLALLHAFEQRGLGLRRGSVDLVADKDVGEDRAGLELEVTPARVVHADAGDVAGQQVRRELDSPWPAGSCRPRARPR